MKKAKLLVPIAMLAGLTLGGCDLLEMFNASSLTGQNNLPNNQQQQENQDDEGMVLPDYSDDVIGEGVVIEVPDTPDEPEVENTGDFSFTTSDGTFTSENGIYTITAPGTYVAKGVLESGQILVNVADNGDDVDDEVVLELSGVSISYDKDSPIKCVSAEKFEISAKKNTENEVNDLRAPEVTEDDSQGSGAISSKADLKLKGTGTLVVNGGYKNGVHTSDDLKIQKQNLYVEAVDNAIKGKDSIEIVSGSIVAVSQKGNGIKTDNTDLSSKGNQRGIIDILGGEIVVDSAQDGIQAAYDLNVDQADESVPTSITVRTGSYSKYAGNYDKNTSAKGLKADNTINIKAGEIVVKGSDDAIHANYGDAFENGETGLGNINISGGVINIASGDDGIHADNTLTISGGQSLITNSVEGIEANHIVVSGGYTKIHGADDGVNASKKINQTPSIVVSGGTLDVQVSSGDTDGIDSNGSFSQTGGLVISRGSPNTASNMSTGLDCDGTASITGGTFIAFNGMEKTPTTGSGVVKAYYGSTQGGGPGGGGPGGGGPGGGGPGGGGWWSRAGSTSTTSFFQSGTYTLSGGDFSKTFYNQYTYSTFIVYSSEMFTGTSYKLLNGETELLSWTQSSSNQQITQ